MSKYKSYKYCFVPGCNSTTISTPGKRFINVPKNDGIRQKWLNMCRRKSGSKTTVFYCCEDHFDLDKDISNMIEHQLTGRSLKLKEGVLPSKFDCQPDRKQCHSYSERLLSIKKRKIEMTETLDNCLRYTFEDLEETTSEKDQVPQEKSVQTNFSVSFRSKRVQTTERKENSDQGIQCSLLRDFQTDNDSFEEELSSEENYSFSSEDSSEEEFFLDKKEYITSNIVKFIEKDSKTYIGIPKEQFYLVEIWSQELKIKVRNIYLTLMKIKTNDSFRRLGDAFAMSPKHASVIFINTLQRLADHVKDFIFMPKCINKLSLPIAFRLNYNKVSQIIDCFDIEIEKPSDPIKQSLTWSEYKKCNTMKFLVACTPNGCVSFVSEGYGGRTTDKMIVESSGFIEKIPGGKLQLEKAYLRCVSMLKDLSDDCENLVC